MLDFFIYGASGYTGRLIAAEAVAQGRRPIAAGRSRDAVEALAAELGCESRVFPLDKPAQIAEHLEGARVVLNCAGPFSATAEPMMDACLAAGVSYLDITGEIDVIEAAHARHQRAVDAGVSLIPAVGFDVVPTDCLAAMLAQRLPDATRLMLGIHGDGPLSPGTTKSILENTPRGGRARIDGRITRVPTAWKTRDIAFTDRTRAAMTIPWGDVASAYYTTGIPNIEVYAAATRRQIARARQGRFLLPLLRLPGVMALARAWVKRNVKGPSADQLAASSAYIWGRVENRQGDWVEGTVQTAGGYPLTVHAALKSVDALLAGDIPPGFHTPRRAFGSEFLFPAADVSFRAGDNQTSRRHRSRD